MWRRAVARTILAAGLHDRRGKPESEDRKRAKTVDGLRERRGGENEAIKTITETDSGGGTAVLLVHLVIILGI